MILTLSFPLKVQLKSTGGKLIFLGLITQYSISLFEG